MFPWQRKSFLSDNFYFFLNCHPILDNKNDEKKKIELHCKQNILNKTVLLWNKFDIFFAMAT